MKNFTINQFTVLAVLCPDTYTSGNQVGELMAAAGIELDRTTIRKLLERLVSGKLVAERLGKQATGKGRRPLIYRLTKAGSRQLEATEKVLREII